jgi:general transcription factor 3C polypeptide 2
MVYSGRCSGVSLSLGPTLFPHQCFLAHSEQVQSVTFSPNASDVITTVSSDRLVRVWNTANVSVPYNEMKRGLMTDSQWLSYWNGIIVAQDDCYNMEHNATYFLECGYWGHQPRLLTPHNGTIWSVTASDWLNAIVSVDSSGEVVGAVLPQMMSNLTNHKPFTKRRFCVYRLETEEMEEMKEYKDLSDENASQTAHHIPDLILTPKQEPQWPPIHCAMRCVDFEFRLLCGCCCCY